MTQDTIAFLDAATMRLSFGEDTTFICATMQIYMRDAPVLAQKALTALRAENNDELASNAHALKGITGYFNKGELYKACLDLEMLGRSGGLPLQAVHALGLWAAINSQLHEMLGAMQYFVHHSSN